MLRAQNQNISLLMDNPVQLLKNEHLALWGQLYLLGESSREAGKETTAVLKTLLRDSTVHFRREALLFRALGSELGKGGGSLHPLVAEHCSLKRSAGNLIRAIILQEGGVSSKQRIGAQVNDFVKQFRSHIDHEETVVFVLAGTRLSFEQQKKIAREMLRV